MNKFNEAFDPIKKHFEELKEKYKDNDKVRISIKKNYVRFDYTNNNKYLFLDITCSLMSLKVGIIDFSGSDYGYEINATSSEFDTKYYKKTFNLNFLEKDNDSISKMILLVNE